MREKYVLIVLFLIISVLNSFSQEKYPRSAIIEGDTLVLLTPSQLTKINSKLIDLRELNELNYELNTQVNLLNSMNNSLKYQISIKDKEIENKSSQIYNLQNSLKIYEEKSKSSKKMIIINGVCISIGIAGVLALVLGG